MKSIDLDVKTKDEAQSFIGECEDLVGPDLFRKDNNGKKINRTY